MSWITNYVAVIVIVIDQNVMFCELMSLYMYMCTQSYYSAFAFDFDFDFDV